MQALIDATNHNRLIVVAGMGSPVAEASITHLGDGSFSITKPVIGDNCRIYSGTVEDFLTSLSSDKMKMRDMLKCAQNRIAEMANIYARGNLTKDWYSEKYFNHPNIVITNPDQEDNHPFTVNAISMGHVAKDGRICFKSDFEPFRELFAGLVESKFKDM
jgi:hypothetical protein